VSEKADITAKSHQSGGFYSFRSGVLPFLVLWGKLDLWGQQPFEGTNMAFFLSIFSIFMLVAVLAWVLANHWDEVHGDNHF